VAMLPAPIARPDSDVVIVPLSGKPGNGRDDAQSCRQRRNFCTSKVTSGRWSPLVISPLVTGSSIWAASGGFPGTGDGMRFSYAEAMTDPTFYIPLAKAAEAAGYASMTIPDSIAYPFESDSKYPYTPDGNREFLDGKPFIET